MLTLNVTDRCVLAMGCYSKHCMQTSCYHNITEVCTHQPGPFLNIMMLCVLEADQFSQPTKF
jgi:hypothetical protein